jgi:hypothetical protein
MMRIGLLAIAAIAGLSLAPAAQAQHFSFGISSGHGHHHGYHHHHHCWDDWWCGPHFGYTYVAPPVRERVIYVQPARTEVWETRAAPPAASTVPRISTTADTGLTIRNSAGHKTPVNFLIDRKEASLADGETRTWTGNSRRSVQFDRGGDYGTANYSLTAGDYEFVVTPAGWDLVKDDSEAARTATATPRKNTLPSGTSLR